LPVAVVTVREPLWINRLRKIESNRSTLASRLYWSATATVTVGVRASRTLPRLLA